MPESSRFLIHARVSTYRDINEQTSKQTGLVGRWRMRMSHTNSMPVQQPGALYQAIDHRYRSIHERRVRPLASSCCETPIFLAKPRSSPRNTRENFAGFAALREPFLLSQQKLAKQRYSAFSLCAATCLRATLHSRQTGFPAATRSVKVLPLAAKTERVNALYARLGGEKISRIGLTCKIRFAIAIGRAGDVENIQIGTTKGA